MEPRTTGSPKHRSSIIRTPRRTQHLEAAIRAFAKGGYYGTSMVEIGQEAGVSQPRLSQMFRSKQNLFTDALALANEAIAARYFSQLTAPFDEDAAHEIVKRICREDPDLARLTFHAVAASQDPQIATAINASLMSFLDYLEQLGATEEQMLRLNSAWMGAAAGLVLRFRTEEEKRVAARVYPGLLGASSGSSPRA